MTKAHPGLPGTHPVAWLPPKFCFPASLSPPSWGNCSRGRLRVFAWGVMDEGCSGKHQKGRKREGASWELSNHSVCLVPAIPNFGLRCWKGMEGLEPAWSWAAERPEGPGKEDPKVCGCSVEENVFQQPPNPSRDSAGREGMECSPRSPGIGWNWIQRGWD